MSGRVTRNQAMGSVLSGSKWLKAMRRFWAEEWHDTISTLKRMQVPFHLCHLPCVGLAAHRGQQCFTTQSLPAHSSDSAGIHQVQKRCLVDKVSPRETTTLTWYISTSFLFVCLHFWGQHLLTLFECTVSLNSFGWLPLAREDMIHSSTSYYQRQHIKPTKWVEGMRGYLDLMEEACRKQRGTRRNLSQKQKLQTPAAVPALFLLQSHCEGIWELACELLQFWEGGLWTILPTTLAKVLLHPMPPLSTHVTW